MKRGFWHGVAALTMLLLAGGFAFGAGQARAQTAAPPAPVTTPTSPPAGPPAPSLTPPVTVPALPGMPPLVVTPGQPAPPGGDTGLDDPNETAPAVSGGSGIDGLVPAPELRGGNDPTLMEKYPASAYKLDTDLGWRDGTDKLLNGIANIVFSLVVGIGVITSRLVQWVFSFNLFEHTGGSIPSVVGELARNLYQPFVIPMIVIAAGWMAWHGLARRRASMATEGAVWVVAALAVAVWFLAAPQAIVNGANGISTGLSRAVLSGMGRIDPRAPLPDNGGATPTYAGDPADNELRSAANTYWTTFVYTPWLVAEFGSVEAGQKYGPAVLAAKSANEYNLQGDQEQAAWSSGNKKALLALKNAEYLKAREDAKTDDETAQSLNGHRAAQRVGISLVALLVITLASVFLLIIAGAVLMASIGLLMLVLTAPIFLLLGIHPTTGRRVFLKWAELCVGTLIKRVAYAAFLSVVMTVMGILLAGTLRIGWGVAAALAVAVFVAGLIYRKPFMAIFSAMGSFSMSTSGESGMGSRLAAGLGGTYLGSRLARRQSPSPGGGPPGVAVPPSRALYDGAHQGAMPAAGSGGAPGVNGGAGKAGMNGAGGAGGAAAEAALPGAAGASGATGAAAGGAALAGAALAGGAVTAEKLRGPMNELAAAAEGSGASGGAGGAAEVAGAAAGAHLRHLHGGRSPIPAETVPTRSLNGHGSDGEQS